MFVDTFYAIIWLHELSDWETDYINFCEYSVVTENCKFFFQQALGDKSIKGVLNKKLSGQWQEGCAERTYKNS